MMLFLFIIAVVANIKIGDSIPPNTPVCIISDTFEDLRDHANAQAKKMDCLYPQYGWSEEWKNRVSEPIQFNFSSLHMVTILLGENIPLI